MSASDPVDRIPTRPKDLRRFCERCARLRTRLVAHVQEHHEEELRGLVAERAEPGGSMENLADAVVDLIHTSESRGESVIDEFLAAAGSLPEPQRRLVRGWKATVMGVFEVTGARGPILQCHNLIDELDYPVLVVGRVAATLRAFPVGSFFVSTLVPALDAWLLNGSQTILQHRSRVLAYGVAAELAQRFPAAFFRNALHLERARALDEVQHQRFLELFGDPVFVGTPDKAAAAYARLVEPRVQGREEAAGDAGDLAQQVAELRDELATTGTFPADLRDADTVGMLSDAAHGLVLLRDFGLFDEAFELGARARHKHRAIVRGYLESAATPPRVFRAAAARHPAGASELFRILLGRPDFSWEQHSDELLRRHKGPQPEEAEIPSSLPLSTKQLAGLALLRAVREGRADAPPPSDPTPPLGPPGRRRRRRLR